MNGLVDYLAEKSQMPVKKAVAKRVYINNAAELLQNPAYTQVLSLLLFANENCEKKEVITPREEVAPQITEPEVKVEEQVEENAEPKKPKKEKKQKDGKQTTLFGFFEKIQNFGGTMFNDEE